MNTNLFKKISLSIIFFAFVTNVFAQTETTNDFVKKNEKAYTNYKKYLVPSAMAFVNHNRGGEKGVLYFRKSYDKYLKEFCNDSISGFAKKHFKEGIYDNYEDAIDNNAVIIVEVNIKQTMA